MNHVWFFWNAFFTHLIHEWNNFWNIWSTLKFSCNINKYLIPETAQFSWQFFYIFQVFPSSFSFHSNRCIKIFHIFYKFFTSWHQMLIQLFMMLSWNENSRQWGIAEMFYHYQNDWSKIRDNPVQFNPVVACWNQNFSFYFIFCFFDISETDLNLILIDTTWYFVPILDNTVCFKFFYANFTSFIVFLVICKHLNLPWPTCDFSDFFVTFYSTLKYYCDINKWIFHT